MSFVNALATSKINGNSTDRMDVWYLDDVS